MMYIENTPLEDNLQDILRNHIPSSGASANATASTILLAEEAYTHLQLRAQEALDAAYRNHTNSIGNGNGSRNGNIIVDRATEFANNVTDLKKLKLKTLPTPPPLRLRAPKSALADIVVNADDEEEENVNEQYELIDVIDIEDKTNGLETQTQPHLHSEQQPIEKVLSDQIIFTFEEEGDSTEYILTKAPKENQEKYANNSSSKKPNLQQSIVKQRTRRPIPAAIPIAEYSKRFATSKHLLNGNLSVFKRCNSAISHTSGNTISSYSYDENSDYFIANGECPVQSDREYEEYNTNSDDGEDFEDIAVNREENSQMGIDIFNKIRQLLNFKSSSNYETQESKRKRRSENWSSDDVTPQPIKYRRVENNFPKIITHKLEDDLDFSGPFPTKQEKQRILLKPRHTFPNSFAMTQRRTLHSNIEKPKMRKSIFTTPQTTHKIVKNTSYADIEFSDDDEPILIKGFGFPNATAASAAVGAGVARSSKIPLATAKVYNIPIVPVDDAPIKFSAKPPPPLIETRTGSILASSLMHESESKRRPTYAEALRQNMPITGGHALGGRPTSTISSSGVSASFSARIFNGLANIRTNPWSVNARSILAQEKETEEREKYQQLLEQVLPRIYGTESNATQLPKNQSSIKRRSALLTAIARDPTVPNRKSLNMQTHGKNVLKRPPLSSTINLDDDDDDDEVVAIDAADDEVTFTGVNHYKSRSTKNIVIDDDDDISDIIDLGQEERSVLSVCKKMRDQEHILRTLETNKDKKRQVYELPCVEPVNTLQERFNTSPHLKDDWFENFELKWNQKKKHRLQELKETAKVAEKRSADRRVAEVELHERMRNFQIVDPELLVIDDFPEPEVEEEPEFIELTPEYQARIKAAICGPTEQVLIAKFNLNITRRDIHTLLGHSWLNDEVINFYMNLLTERGDKKHDSHGLPRVYAMNTFFIPRLLQAGHSGVKRWTRKVDIFTKDVIPVPVHVGGVHWCMAIIHLKNRTIKYYDSMGTPNPSVLSALEQYLKDESMDKRKQTFDTSQFDVESVRDVPRQMNGSDCGVFSCMFAEYITRNKEITFTQQNMEYFRHKMILEIVQGELLH